MTESPSGKREGFQDNATRKKKGSLLLTRARASVASNAVVQGQKSLEPSCYINLYGEHKQLVAGLSRLVTCLQSNVIGTNYRGLLFKLRHSRAFLLSLMFPLFPFGRMLIGWLCEAVMANAMTGSLD